jgi:hypothetical protein
MFSGRAHIGVGFFAFLCTLVLVGTTSASANVTSATLSVDHATYSGPCPVTLSFTGSIAGTPGTSFTWQWNRGGGVDPALHHVTLDATGHVNVAETIVQAASGIGWDQLWVHAISGGQSDVYSAPRTSYTVSCVAPTPTHAPLHEVTTIRVGTGPTPTPLGHVITCIEGCGRPPPVTVDVNDQSFAYVTDETSDADLFFCTNPHPMEPLVTTFPAGLVPVGFANQQRGGASGDVCGHHRDIVYRAFVLFDLRYHIVVRPVYKVFLVAAPSGVDVNGGGPCAIHVYTTGRMFRGHLGHLSDFGHPLADVGDASALPTPHLDITSLVLVPPPAVPGTLVHTVLFMLVGGDESFGHDQRRCVIPARWQVLIQNSS